MIFTDTFFGVWNITSSDIFITGYSLITQRLRFVHFFLLHDVNRALEIVVRFTNQICGTPCYVRSSAVSFAFLAAPFSCGCLVNGTISVKCVRPKMCVLIFSTHFFSAASISSIKFQRDINVLMSSCVVSATFVRF